MKTLRRSVPSSTLACCARSLVVLLVAHAPPAAIAAPLPPLGKIDVTGTIAEARWVPEATLRGRKGFSGSLGRDRVTPAHFVVTLRDYAGPTVKQAWMMNGFMGAVAGETEDRGKLPPTLVVWVNSGDRELLKVGMRIRLVDYTVSGDEGGTWTSCERVKILTQ